MSYLKVCVLRSSSSGNCTAIWTAKSGILIDCAGIGLKEIEKDLRGIELDPTQINGIVITHGHEDQCLSTCDAKKVNYCIAKALTHAYRGELDKGFVMCGSNACRIKKIISVKELIAELSKDARSYLREG